MIRRIFAAAAASLLVAGSASAEWAATARARNSLRPGTPTAGQARYARGERR